MARHNREGEGEDQHGRRYIIGYQPDWFHQVKVARGLDSGRQSTKILLRNSDTPLADPGPLAARLAAEFKERKELQIWKEGLEGRADLPPDQRIEKTVFVKAPTSFKYGDVVRVIDAIKGAGASPVGLQTEALEP